MSKALVVLSGGQDSTTCMAIASRAHTELHAITINYGQRHITELQSARKIGELFGVKSHDFIDCQGILKGSSPLISKKSLGKYEDISELPGGVEPTFVPARNILFLTIAANRAAVLGCEVVYTGVCEADFGGYFDCRQRFIDALEVALNEGIYGTNTGLKVNTPLMYLTKRETVLTALEVLGEERFNEVFEKTHTCYDGVKGGCGKCHACHIRDRGFKDAGVIDPIWKFRN